MGANADSRGVCLRVDLDAIAENARRIRALLGGARLMAVVKANAYGHGLVPAARAALSGGASWLGVATPEEGRALRDAGIDAPVLILGGTGEAGARIAVQSGLTQTVFDARGVELIEAACEATEKTACVHIKLDTGMNRIGARDEAEVRAVLSALERAPRVRLTGVFTHFADAENADERFTRRQFERFKGLCGLLPAGLIRHAAASAAMERFPWARLDMARAGIALYGCAEGFAQLSPAMRWVTRVVCVKTLRAGDTVGYGRAFRAEAPLRAATVAIGYGDGYPRACSGRAGVLIHGALCTVLGRVCMDQMMVDVSGAGDVRPGDEAVLLGAQGNERITAAQLAAWADTISYEILLSPSARVPVIYEGNECTDGKTESEEERRETRL